MEAIRLLVKGVVVVGGIVGIELYGLYFAVSAFIFYCFLALLDTAIGYGIAHKNKVVTSKAGGDGFMTKLIWMILLAGLIFFLGNMSHTIANDTATQVISIIVIVVIVLRIFFELISILENIAIISNERERGILTWIIGLAMKVFGIGQKQLEEKIKKYLPKED